ncbi:hypothetical protein DYU11_18875 [Fibrisoma montanum]|uniref:Uncharacterized protein n=1 Tax=Fibrisoma montanum TaxID=2305895 RepID=A0A418M699_9BACT|nr:hypothetical protein [Fibrisoma montanum]RIV21468.1 hypothetical protein DYU11_18875 [Fibrisoma montanum]
MSRQSTTTVVYALIIWGFLFLLTPTADAQLATQCRCEDLPTNHLGFLPNETEAIKRVEQMLTDMKRYAHLKFTETIRIKETKCTIPTALICERMERYITYNNDYLNRITKKDAPMTWVDQHVLAHEIGHHVLGHLDGRQSFIDLDRAYNRDTKGKKGALSQLALAGPQAQEIEADFFGLWYLFRTDPRFQFQKLVNSYDTLFVDVPRQNFTPAPTRRKGAPKSSVESATHLTFDKRIWAMEQFWNELKARPQTIARAGYFADAAGAAYVALRSEHPFWDVGLVAGLTVAGRPQFQLNGAPVDALLYSPAEAANLYLGLSVSRFQWQRPWRFEGDVAWSQQRYGTLFGNGNSQRLIEDFTLRYLTVFPRVSWSPTSRRQEAGFSVNRFGWFVGLGPSVRIPLKLSYTNNAVVIDPGNVPALEFSVSPRLSLGVEWLKKTFLPRGYKLAVSYEPQFIRFRATPTPRMLSHNLDLTIAYTLFRG